MLHVSLEGLGASVLRLVMVGSCCKSAWRMGCGICSGMSDGDAGMVVDHLACLLAISSRPYVAEQKVGRVTVNE